jgi:hypothetical protein
MTYVVFTLLCIAIGVYAVFRLFKQELPKPEDLRVAWKQSPAPPVGPMAQVPLRIAGPNRYCPSCSRLLVNVHDDGTFDIAGQASLRAHGELDVASPPPATIEALLVEARCLLCDPED